MYNAADNSIFSRTMGDQAISDA